jgi:hypothetical protein
MRSSWAFIKSIPAVANVLAVATMAVWIVKVIWLDGLPGAFPSAHDLGGIVDELLSAMMAGYIFYIVFALLPEHRERTAIAPYLQVHIARVAGDCLGILHEINAATGSSLSLIELDRTNVEAAFAQIGTQSHPNMVGPTGAPVTWFQYFAHQRARTQTELARLDRQARFFGSTLAHLLAEIDANHFFFTCESMGNLPVRNANLGVLGKSFFDYATICRAVATYHDKQFVPPGNPVLSRE